MSEFITVKASDHPSELMVAKSYLESEDIPCVIKDELISQVYSMASNAWGGAKLQVAEEDFEQAVKLLVEGGFAKKEDYEPTSSDMFLVRLVEKIKNLFKMK